jgi:hypothetical protein
MFQTNVVEKNKTHFTLRNFFFENRAIYEIVWKNMVDPGRPQMAIWHMRHACWIPKAININSEYVLLIAFPLQQWLHERASVLERETCIAYLVYNTVDLPINFQLSPPPPPPQQLLSFNPPCCKVS